jgi:hypothetical protein
VNKVKINNDEYVMLINWFDGNKALFNVCNIPFSELQIELWSEGSGRRVWLHVTKTSTLEARLQYETDDLPALYIEETSNFSLPASMLVYRKDKELVWTSEGELVEAIRDRNKYSEEVANSALDGLRGSVWVACAVQFYILHHQQDLELLEKKRVNERKTVKRKGRYVYDNKIRIDHIYRLNNIERGVRKKVKIECPVWGVRGHYRHYQNGKVIFIAEYKKGKKRHEQEPTGREYIIHPR